MDLGPKAGRVLALAACASAAAAPFACGSSFSAGGSAGDAMAPDASAEVGGGDVTLSEGAADAHPEATAGDGPMQVDGIAVGEAGVSTVKGTVVDAYLLPMGGLDVHCQGQKATTAFDGTFTLTGITRPYSATVIVPQGTGRKHGYVFEGVSRVDPTLQLAGEQAQATVSATLTGSSAGTTVNGSGIVFADFPGATPATANPTIPIAIGATSYSGSLAWTGHATASTTAYMLQWLTTNGVPSVYTSFVSASQTLTAGGTTTYSPGVTTVGASSMTVTVTPSTGYVPVDVGLYFRPPSAVVAAPIEHGLKNGLPTTTIITPAVPNATFVACGLQVRTDFDGGANSPFGYACTTGLGDHDSPTVSPPPGTTFVSPPSTASVGTVFSYAALTGGVYFVSFVPTGSATGTSDALYVVTGATQAAVPDLSALAFVFHAGDSFTAEVFGVAPFSGIDGALGVAGYSERLNHYRFDTGPTTSGSLAYGGSTPFTAQ